MSYRRTCACEYAWRNGPCSNPDCGRVDAPEVSHSAPPSLCPRCTTRFPVLTVSAEFHELFSAALSAAVALGAATTEGQAALAYGNLNLCREELVKYVERVEKRAGVQREIVLRF